MYPGLEIRPLLQSGTAKKCAGMAKKLPAIPMKWQILGHPRTKAISRNDSFYSGMTVSLTCQSCGLACPQRLILPLCSHQYWWKLQLSNLFFLFRILPTNGLIVTSKLYALNTMFIVIVFFAILYQRGATGKVYIFANILFLIPSDIKQNFAIYS